MPSPFPGMDPYLERGFWNWEELHQGIVQGIRDALAPQFPPGCSVVVQQRVYTELWRQEEREEPFVGRFCHVETIVLELDPVFGDPEGKEESAPSQQVVLPFYQEVREGYIEICDGRTGEVVTAIEVLSPRNKRPGEGREAYERMRQDRLRSATSLVEIDLLRAGEPMVMEPRAASDYRILVAAGWQQPRARFFPFGLRDPIPVISVPLREGVPAAKLAVGEILGAFYDRESCRVYLNYRVPPPAPSLTPEDTAWMEALLDAHGMGKRKAQFDDSWEWAQNRREAGLLRQDLVELQEAVRRHPDDGDLRCRLGLALWYGDDHRGAVRQLREATRLDPSQADTCLFLAGILRDEGDRDGSLAFYRQAVRAAPRNQSALRCLGDALIRAGQVDEGLALHRDASDQERHSSNDRWSLGQALQAAGRLQEEVALFREGVRLEPEQWWTHQHLALALAEVGENEEAFAEYLEMFRLDLARTDSWHYLEAYWEEPAKREAVVAMLRDAVAAEPANPWSLLWLGVALLRGGEGEAGRRALREAARLDCSDPDFRLQLGAALEWTGCFQEAILAYRAAVEGHGAAAESNREAAMAYARLGIALLRSGQKEAGIDACCEALQLCPEDEGFRFYEPIGSLETEGGYYPASLVQYLKRRGLTEEAVAVYRRRVEEEPEEAGRHFALAETLWRVRRRDAAVEAALEGISRERDPRKWPHEVIRLLMWDRPDEYFAAYRELLAQRPEDSQAHAGFGWLLIQRDRVEEGLAELREAVRLEPENLPSARALARALDGHGHSEEAMAIYDDLHRRDPDDPEARGDLARTLIHVGRSDEGFAHLNALLQAYPDDPRLHCRLGYALAFVDRIDEALSQFRAAIQRDPSMSLALANAAETLAKRGRVEAAITLCREAMRLVPDEEWERVSRSEEWYGRWNAHVGLGRLLREVGRFEESLAEARERLRVEPENAWTRYEMGQTLSAMGRRSEARAAWESALAICLEQEDADGGLEGMLREALQQNPRKR